MNDNEIKLTKQEERAIARLQKLANTWPQTLTLFSCSGNLIVCKTPKNDEGGGYLDYEVAEIFGIPNDGGGCVNHERAGYHYRQVGPNDYPSQ